MFRTLAMGTSLIHHAVLRTSRKLREQVRKDFLKRIRLTAVGLGTCNFLAFLPTVLSPDSETQLREGTQWIFSDIHPPLLSALLGILNRTGHGPALVMAMNLTFFWSALYCLTVGIYSKSKSEKSIWIFVIGLCPAILNHSGIIWKDTGMAFSWSFAVSLIFSHFIQNRSIRLPTLLGIWLLIFYGTAVRFNSFSGLFPVALFFSIGLLRVTELSFKRTFQSLVLTMGLIASIATPVLYLNHKLVTNKAYIMQWIYLYDLTAISIGEGTDRFLPDYQTQNNPYYSFEKLKKSYNPVDAGSLFYLPPDAPLRLTQSPDEVRHIRSLWLHGITEHPWPYLKHRLDIFSRLMGIRENVVSMEIYFGVLDVGYYDRFMYNPLASLLWYYLHLAKYTTPFFKGWFWLSMGVLSLLLNMKALKRRLGIEYFLPSLLIGSSGLLYILPFTLISATAEFRYCYWMIVSICLAIGIQVLGIRDVLAKKKRPFKEVFLASR